MNTMNHVRRQLEQLAKSSRNVRVDDAINRIVSENKEALQETRILVFAKGEQAIEARTSGADCVGGEELVPKIQHGWNEFDIVVGTPEMMPVIGRIAKELGYERGIMPTPKSGTITNDVVSAITKIRTGEISYHLKSYYEKMREPKNYHKSQPSNSL